MIPDLDTRTYSVKEVAHIMGVSEKFILRRITTDGTGLAAYKVGRSYRLFLDDVAKYFHIPLQKLTKGV